MVWTAVVKFKVPQKETSSIIFESSHDSELAYIDLLSRNKLNKEWQPISEVVAMIPGRHTSVYFPRSEDDDA